MLHPGALFLFNAFEWRGNFDELPLVFSNFPLTVLPVLEPMAGIVPNCDESERKNASN
jgi:hypothetical protein